jgi:hypothetical protein
MDDVSELIAKVSQDLGPDASDEEISEKVLKAIEALPESDRAQVLTTGEGASFGPAPPSR